MNKPNLPHTGKMVLIDEILACRADFIEVCAVIKADNAFLDDQKFATYKAIEMMAQSLGAYKGVFGENGFNIGFLVGIREFEIFVPYLNLGDKVTIRSQASMQDANGFGVWASEIYVRDKLVAMANLSVLSPSKEMFLEIKNG